MPAVEPLILPLGPGPLLVTRAPRGADELPDLLLEWNRAEDFARWRTASWVSGVVHVVFTAGLAFMPSTFFTPSLPERKMLVRVIPLYTPTTLTQKTPNKAKVSEDITAERIAPHPKVATPAPSSGKGRPNPAPPTPETPKPVIRAAAIPEPPKLETKPSVQLALNLATPQIQPQEHVQEKSSDKPKIAFENVPQYTPGGRGTGMLRVPEAGVSASMRDMAKSSGNSGTRVGDSSDLGGSGEGLNLPPSPGRPQSNLELLSDPKGVDFRPYLLQVLAAVRRNWFAVYPESAKMGQRGSVILQFAIAKTGRVNKVVFTAESGVNALDRAAVAAISASDPLPPLPPDFNGDRVVLQLTFQYNMQLRR